jgi:hypothetical protein
MPVTDIKFDKRFLCLSANGKTWHSDVKLSLLLNGVICLCEEEETELTRDPRLVELGMRYWRWANALIPRDVGQELLDEADALEAIIAHRTVLEPVLGWGPNWVISEEALGSRITDRFGS